MADNNEPSLDEMLKALSALSADDVQKLYLAVREEGRKKGCPFARRFAIQSRHSRPRY